MFCLQNLQNKQRKLRSHATCQFCGIHFFSRHRTETGLNPVLKQIIFILFLCSGLLSLEQKKQSEWNCMYDISPFFFFQSASLWSERIFTKGCIPALEAWLPRNIYIVAGVFVSISLLQVSLS